MNKREQEIIDKVRGLAEPALALEGLELVEVQYRREQAGWMLRLFIDRAAVLDAGRVQAGMAEGPHGSGVTLEDCVAVSREIGQLLDVEDAVPGSYRLEVSSPGLDRPLTKPGDFVRFAGKKVTVKAEGPEGKRTVRGVLIGLDDGQVRLNVDGRETAIPYDQVTRAQLVPEVNFSRAS